MMRMLSLPFLGKLAKRRVYTTDELRSLDEWQLLVLLQSVATVKFGINHLIFSLILKIKYQLNTRLEISWTTKRNLVVLSILDGFSENFEVLMKLKSNIIYERVPELLLQDSITPKLRTVWYKWCFESKSTIIREKFERIRKNNKEKRRSERKLMMSGKILAEIQGKSGRKEKKLRKNLSQ